VRRSVRLVLFAALALTFGGALAWAAGPMTVRSDGGHFILQVTGIVSPEAINHMHGFDLSLTTADGQPVSGATIGLTGDRRFAPNPLPTMPQVSAASPPGHYRVEGLRFHMAGEWHLVFTIDFAQIRDRAVLGVVVK
jgi:hypothetical protein